MWQANSSPFSLSKTALRPVGLIRGTLSLLKRPQLDTCLAMEKVAACEGRGKGDRKCVGVSRSFPCMFSTSFHADSRLLCS